jgi:hypothetical protein
MSIPSAKPKPDKVKILLMYIKTIGRKAGLIKTIHCRKRNTYFWLYE